MDNSGEAPRLRYVFDIADTGTRRSSRPFSPWAVNDANLTEVQFGLKQDFGADGKWLSEPVAGYRRNLAEMYFDAHRHDIGGIVDGSLMAGYDEGELRDSFIKPPIPAQPTHSFPAAAMTRRRTSMRADFAFLSEWDTSEAVTALGTAVSENTQMVLRQIERTIRSYERSQTMTEITYDRERRPTSEPEPARDGANEAATGGCARSYLREHRPILWNQL